MAQLSQRKKRIEVINMLYRHFLMEYPIEKTRQDSFDYSQSITNEITYNEIDNLLNNIDEITKLISSNLKSGWNFERISNYHKALLTYGAYELVYIKTDKPIVINEIIEIARKYGEDENIDYINAILDKIA